MTQPFLLNKPPGLTPSQAIQQLKQQQAHYAHGKISPAGRLDPMAEGLLVLLVDQLNKQQTTFLNLPKTYQAVILFGISTDTYDLLGLSQGPIKPHLTLPPHLSQVLHQLVGPIHQPYPPYSAVRVNGQPLFHWARKGLLDDINIPTVTRSIMSIQKVKESCLSNKHILDYCHRIIPSIAGDFRQSVILDHWNQLLRSDNSYPTITIQVACSSGTYIRSLAHQIGQQLDMPATCLAIRRLSVGPFQLDQANQLSNQPLYQHSLFLSSEY